METEKSVAEEVLQLHRWYRTEQSRTSKVYQGSKFSDKIQIYGRFAPLIQNIYVSQELLKVLVNFPELL